MNPLDLPGPTFLTFYVLFGAVVLAVGRWIRHLLQQAHAPGPSTSRFTEGYYPRESEVYHVAFLRGGATELAHTARVVAEIQQAPASPAESVSAPDPSRIEEELEREGLTLDSAGRLPFIQLRAVALVLLMGLAGAKIYVALERGRTNVGYLVVLTVAFCFFAVTVLRPPRVTQAGRSYLAWANRAHDGLLSLVNQGRRTTPGEVALCAALYGLAPLTVEPVERLKRTLRAEAAASSTGGAAGCSSGGGGSSCGGGCGGGGCGGCGG